MAIKLITRNEWGARARRAGAATPFDPRGVTIHWEGAGWTAPWDHSTCDNKVRSIQAFHMDSRGWSDIAYNFLACPHGYVYEGRGLNRRSAANGSYTTNTYWYAIQCMWGTKSGSVPDELLNGCRDAIDYCRTKGGAGPLVNGHRDHKSTDCPGDQIYAWLKGGAPYKGTVITGDVTVAAEAIRWAAAGTRPGLSLGEKLLTGQYAGDAGQFMGFAAADAIKAIPKETTLHSWLTYRDSPTSPFGPYGHELVQYAILRVRQVAGLAWSEAWGPEVGDFMEKFGYTIVDN